MADTVIRVHDLGKRYLIGAARGGLEGPPGLRHVLEAGVRRIVGRLRGRGERRRTTDELWALKDVSFEVKRGECVGVIGCNGAGKSTLLKVLSRITEPTTGEVRLRGRVGSLLEVGTGFHPELTGRENIYLNGNILGMTRREVKAKFDEIVAFSEVERFLDTPVKRYSSGMYVRLAFAVAAHLEPEILIVDEVLAVGDAAFQKKCLGRMTEVAGHGRTVLFVSHSMAAVTALCQSAVLLAGGRAVFVGGVDEAVERYQARSGPADGRREFVESTNGIRLADVRLVAPATGQPTVAPIFGQDYQLVVDLDFVQPHGSVTLIVKVHDPSGVLVSSLCSAQEGVPPQRLSGLVRYEFKIPRLPLLPRPYSLSVSVSKPHDGTDFLAEDDAFRFEVQPAIVNNAMWPYTADRGYVRLSDGARLGPG
jgi:lipopolysaccharide transport system ATP-binding protein